MGLKEKFYIYAKPGDYNIHVSKQFELKTLCGEIGSYMYSGIPDNKSICPECRKLWDG